MKKTMGIKRWAGAGVLTLLPALSWGAEPAARTGVPEPTLPRYLGGETAPFRLPPVEAGSLPPAPATLADSVLIRRIAVRGNTVIPSEELIAVVAERIGQRMNAADLEDIRLALTRHYIARGYVNSGVVLPADAVAGDTLNLEVVEGRLREVRLRGLDGLNEAYLRGRLAADPAAVLNVESLREKFQLVLDDPLFQRLNARLLPGERAGEAVLEVDVERAKPYRISGFANNYRPPSIGSLAAGMSAVVRNLSGYGDALDLTLQSPQKDWGEVRSSLAWRLPLGSRGSWLALQYEHGRSSVVEEPMRSLDLKSILDSREIGLGQTLYESLSHRLALGFGYLLRENRTTLGGLPFSFTAGEPDGLTRIRARRFWQEYSYRTEKQVLALRSTFTTASNNLQDMRGLPGPAAPAASQRYDVWLGQWQYARQLSEQGTQLILRGAVQHSGSRLLALDRMAIGGVTTVRGYRENQLVRDRGSVVNVEVDVPLYRAGERGPNLSVLPFYDVGRGKNRGEAGETLSSAGVAASLRWQGWRVDLAVAKRLVHPAAIHGGSNWQDKGVHLQIAYDFN